MAAKKRNGKTKRHPAPIGRRRVRRANEAAGFARVKRSARSIVAADADVLAALIAAAAGAPPTDDVAGALPELIEKGLFDEAWYVRRYPDVLGTGIDPAMHFATAGAAEGRWPNFLFDPEAYRLTHLEGALDGPHPIVHYMRQGEAAGLQPSVLFDLRWYRQKYLGAFSDVNALGHYIRYGRGGRFDPNPYFDSAYYLRENADVAQSGIHALEHFLTIGYREGRNPSPHFDVRYYQNRYLAGGDLNPLLHYVEVGRTVGHSPDPNADPTAATEVRRFARPAPEFEATPETPAASPDSATRVVALYLPQFHPFPENDRWWGTGFTEWTNLARGTPRFAGHYQPRIPRDFGFYDLRDPSVMRRHAAAAQAAGLGGFCFYYYNFNGKRLLHGPLEDLLGDAGNDFPFCIMWANENWSRRWDGSEAELLMRQDYRAEDAAALIADFVRHFRDPRYIRIGGRPLLFIYRAGIVPDAKKTIARWRDLFWSQYQEEPLIFMAQTFTDVDPADFGLDGAIEFPPHKILGKVATINPTLRLFDPAFAGHVYRYDEVVTASLSVPKPSFPLIKTVFPSWDNDARRQGRGVAVINSTPAKYQAWLEGAMAFAEANPVGGEKLVFVNAWNEWAEGAYLEPDVHFGWAYLNATARAIARARKPMSYPVIVAADCRTATTRDAALAFVRTAARVFGCDVHVVAPRREGLPREMSEVASVHVVANEAAVAQVLEPLLEKLAPRHPVAVTFGTAIGDLLPALRRRAGRVVAVIDEMPTTIVAAGNLDKASIISHQAGAIVAPSEQILRGMERLCGAPVGRSLVLAPALGSVKQKRSAERAALFAKLGLKPGTRLVVNAGAGSMQAGVDLFAAAARIVVARRVDVAFAWFGDVDPELELWLKMHLPESSGLQFRSGNLDPLLADVVAASAREDGSGALVAQALGARLPVVAFDGGGTGAELVAAGGKGKLVPFGDVGAFAAAIMDALDHLGGTLPAALSAGHDDDDGRTNAFEVLRAADRDLLSITAAVVADADVDAAEATLKAVLAQTYPLFEVLVAADHMNAQQLAHLKEVARAARRDVRFVPSRVRRDEVGELLADAAAIARGALLWCVPAGYEPPARFAAGAGAGLDVDAFAMWQAPAGTAIPGLQSGPHRAAEILAALGEAQSDQLGLGSLLWRRRALADVLGETGEAGTIGDILERGAGERRRISVLAPAAAKRRERRLATVGNSGGQV